MWSWKPRLCPSLVALLAISLTVALACGSSATSTPAAAIKPVSTTAVTAPAPATATPALAVGTPSAPIAGATPTRVPTVAPSATPAAAVQPKVDRLVVGQVPAGQETNFNWLASGSAIAQYTPYAEFLIHLRPNGDFEPMLATKWEVTPDAKTWTFTLRPNVPYHFGYGNFTSKDVVHSMSLLQRPDGSCSRCPDYRTRLAAVDTPNDTTAIFRLKDPDVTWDWIAASGSDMVIRSKAQWDKEGIDGLNTGKPAGTGPYQYVSRSIGTSILFERAPGAHWRITPAFRQLEIRFVPEDSTRLAMLLTGEAHIVQLPNDLEKNAVGRGMKVAKAGFPNNSTTFIFGGLYQLTPDKYDPKLPWVNVKVREALNRSINRKEMMTTIFGDKAVPAYNHLYYTNTPGWNPDWEKNFEDKYGYNPTRAKQLLAEAGYPNGLKIKMSLYPFPQQAEIPQLTEALANYFKAIGVDSELIQQEFGTVRNAFRAKNLSGIMYSLAASYQPMPGNLRTYYDSKNGTVFAYEDQYIQERYDKLVQTVDPTERARLLREIGDYKYNVYSDMPLALAYFAVTVNPNIVASWPFAGIGYAQFSDLDYAQAPR